MPRKMTRKAEHAKLLREHRKYYDELLRYQRGGCAICGRPPKNRRLDMDHHHKSMQVRGLLCVRCNRALPDWMDVEWLIRAIAYLREPPFAVIQQLQKENNG